jgi:hypothetical protein
MPRQNAAREAQAGQRRPAAQPARSEPKASGVRKNLSKASDFLGILVTVVLGE